MSNEKEYDGNKNFRCDPWPNAVSPRVDVSAGTEPPKGILGAPMSTDNPNARAQGYERTPPISSNVRSDLKKLTPEIAGRVRDFTRRKG
jgi:hypothetical protein